MKGKNVSAKQKKYHDVLASNIGCLPCLIETGERNTWGSIHHIDGRTKPYAHWYVLFLCDTHHQNGTDEGATICVHPHKARFEKRYGRQVGLVAMGARQLIEMGIAVPDEVLELAGDRV